jgi:hypothetical protein
VWIDNDVKLSCPDPHDKVGIGINFMPSSGDCRLAFR